ncbi:hypothetical protein SDC9_198216 [bioreactor metagenome]|uniref:Uncharacterized protein n=1 Tax=bioreactor metagenome TaxID=1076179 RepID=A0A645IH28_9ZZZZ
MAFFDRDKRHRRFVKICNARNDRWVVREAAIAVQLDKVRKNIFDIVFAGGAVIGARGLDFFKCVIRHSRHLLHAFSESGKSCSAGRALG